MSLGNQTENDLQRAMFYNGDTPAWFSNTNLFLSAHTADPGEGGDQSTSEATYTGYARVTVVRTSAGWSCAGNVISNASLVQFPQCTGGTNTLTYVAVGTTATGAGQIIASGVLGSSLAVANGIQPQFAAGALTLTMD